ncbi:MAG: NTP transferase domain-containing protein [Candidatus Didemnitutus sp.]|nr:NTP transferase domain-containing protein [Candidatus Didemnitutus sp.]
MKIAALHLSAGHNFVGHHGQPAGTHPINSVASVECVAGRGLRGDRFWDHKPDFPGQITFFAEEVHRALLRELQPSPCPAGAYRRNVITRGVDLNTLVGREFTVQGVRFLGTVECKPCYWMDQAVGPGANVWLRGRGGLRAKILSDGVLQVDCPTATGLLLAGGRSLRMGRDKATLDWRGRPLGEHQATTLIAMGAWPLLLSCRRDQPWTPRGFTRVEDQDDQGVLGAFVGAFAAAGTPVVTSLAIDVPHVAPEWLEVLTGRARETGVSVVPVHKGYFEPLVAAWHRSALPDLQAALAAGTSLQLVCTALVADGRLQPHVLSAAEVGQLANLNTPADLTPGE